MLQWLNEILTILHKYMIPQPLVALGDMPI